MTSLESIVRPFTVIPQTLPAPAKGSVPLPGEGTGAFISWGATSSFATRPPAQDLGADDQCSSGLGNRQIIWPSTTDEPAPVEVSDTSGPATSGARAEADPTDASAQTLLEYWTANGYTIAGSGNFYTVDPATKTVTWYATEVLALQARETLNLARQSGLSGGGAGGGGGGGGGSVPLVTNPGATPPSNDPTTTPGVDAGHGTVAARPLALRAAAAKIAKTKTAPQDRAPGIIPYNEIDRTVETITVYKPGDNDIWVNVQRVLSIRFRAPNNTIVKFNMKPPLAPPRPQQGSND